MHVVNQIIIFIAATLVSYILVRVSMPPENALSQEGIVAISALKSCGEIQMRKYKGSVRLRCVEKREVPEEPPTLKPQGGT